MTARITTSAPAYTPPLSDWQRDRRDPVLQPVSFGNPRRFRIEVALTGLIVVLVAMFAFGRALS